jgi:hypothetical protein
VSSAVRYILTEVKRLSPGGQRENRQVLAAPGRRTQKIETLMFRAIVQSERKRNPEIKKRETLISRSRKPEYIDF